MHNFSATTRKKDKMSYLKAIDAELQLLLVLFSISKEQKYISKGRAKLWQDKIAELGKINGGLMKTL